MDGAPAPASQCQGCALRARCRGPRRWTPELHAFGSGRPSEAWRAFRGEVERELGLVAGAELDGLIDIAAGVSLGDASQPAIVEPSLLIEDGVLPELRAIVFPAEPARGPHASAVQSAAMIETLAALHRRAGERLPQGLAEVLRAHGPISLPSGFELSAAGELTLKAYVRLAPLPPATRRMLVTDLARLSRAGDCSALAAEEVPWQDVDMVGFASAGSSVQTVKLYVRRDPRKGWGDVGLPPVPTTHPLYQLSGGQALAVFDLRQPRARAPKWDFRLRDQLLGGPAAVSRLAGAMGDEAQAQLVRVLGSVPVHCHVVAAGLRAGRLALYWEIG